MRRARTVLWVASGLVCAACWGCSSSKTGTDAGVTADAGDTTSDSGTPPDTGLAPADAGTPDSGADDGNDGFDQAVEATKNASFGTPGAIDWPGDRDYFTFEGEAGEFVSVFTTSTPSRLGNQVDTVIRLYDAAMVQVAENDDAVPRVDVNSEIIYRLPAAGRYFVEVLEWSDWAQETPVGAPDYRYRVSVVTLRTTTSGLTVEAEAGDDLASAIDTSFSSGAGILCGHFEDDTDVDVFAFTLPGPSTYLFVPVMPVGSEGYGSTTPLGQVRITDPTGTDTIAQFELGEETTDFSPSLAAGDYLLWLAHPTAAAGANDFYVMKPFALNENPPEVEPNDDIESADPRDLLPREQQMDRAAFLLTHLPDGDVDYFELAIASNETVSIVCGAQSEGSGVRGLSVELLTMDGAVVAGATETAEAVATLEAQPQTTDPVYVRLSKASQAPMVTGDYVRCGIFATIE